MEEWRRENKKKKEKRKVKIKGKVKKKKKREIESEREREREKIEKVSFSIPFMSFVGQNSTGWELKLLYARAPHGYRIHKISSKPKVRVFFFKSLEKAVSREITLFEVEFFSYSG